MPNFNNLTGKRFSYLEVLSLAEIRRGTSYWSCKCDCGKHCIVQGYQLTSGKTRSCGHLVGKTFAHGKSKTKIYNIWSCMKNRCFNPNHAEFKNYGGRGIKIFEEWIDDFQAFYDYVSKLPHFGEKGYTLDRINNNGNYEPNNLRWASKKTQNRNRTDNIFVEYEGEKILLADAIEKSGLNRHTVLTRFYRGVRGEKLFQAPKGKGNSKLKIDDAFQIRKLYDTGKYTQNQIAEKFCVDITTISLIIRGKIWRNGECPRFCVS